MQRIFAYTLSLITLIFLTACGGEPEGTLIKGNLPDAANLQIALDKVKIAGKQDQVAIAAIDANGDFALGFVEGLAPGTYQLRVGARRALLALEEGDHVINLKGQLATLDKYTYSITGSPASAEIVSTMQALTTKSVQIADLEEMLQGISNAEAAAFIAYNALGKAGKDGIPVQKAMAERLPDTNPMKASFNNYIRAMEQRYAQQQAAELIQVGQPAPDIHLPNPDGKEYALSDLKGQVVLLDFWASWCGPCRRENPNVVKVYDKYKKDGFTIYSVSLDGPDARRTAGLSAEQVEAMKENGKRKWLAAIEKDKLSWPYHVSELSKWNSIAGQTYGVRGIPKTFLIDRDGKIAAVGLRGAASIESALQKVL